MNNGITLLFLLVFGISSTGQVFAQPSNGTSPEGLKITKEHQQFVGQKRPESKVKATTSGIGVSSKTALPGAKKKIKCPKGAEPPDCVSLPKPDHKPLNPI